jgi:hypothetical protein
MVNVLWPTTTPGTIESGRPGDADIVVTYEGATARHHVLVIAPGTFRLSGTIRASDGRRLTDMGAGMRAATLPNLTAPADLDGHFTLYGVAGAVEIWGCGSSADFPCVIANLVVTEDSTYDFVLTPYPPAGFDLSGAWTYSLSASPACRDRLPEALRERTYDMALVQTGAKLDMTLFGPTVSEYGQHPGQHGEVNAGTLHGDVLNLAITGDTDYGSWSLTSFVELLGPAAYSGLAILSSGTVGGSEIRLPTRGDIEFWDVPYPEDGTPSTICRATDHLVVLRRK